MTAADTKPNLDDPRPARPEDYDAMMASVDDVFRVSRGLPSSMADDYPHVYGPENLPNVMIVKDGPRVASSTGLWVNQIRLGSVTLTIGGINAVTTLPAYRRLGLGGKVMDRCAQRMKELGCHVGLLSTAITNWYRKLGWENAGTACFYQLNRSNVTLLPRLDASVRIHDAGKAPDNAALESLVRLRHGDCLGGIRTTSLTGILQRAKKQPRVIFALQDDNPVAYLLVRDRAITEWAGEGHTVAGLIRGWYETCDDPRASTSARGQNNQVSFSDLMDIVAPARGHPIADLLRSIGLPCQTKYLGMLLIVDPKGILEAFGYRDISVRQQNDEYTLEHGGSRVTVTAGQLAKLLFGPERVCDFANEILPLPIWQWALERV